MKRIFIVVMMLLAVMAPMASAANERTPIVYIRGNGDGLFYEDGTLCVAQFEDLSLGGEGGIDLANAVIEAKEGVAPVTEETAEVDTEAVDAEAQETETLIRDH